MKKFNALNALNALNAILIFMILDPLAASEIPLTLRWIDEVKQSSPQLKSDAASLEKKSQDVKIQRSRLWPTLTARATVSGRSIPEAAIRAVGNFDLYSGLLEVRQPLYVGGALTSAINDADATYTQAKLQYTKAVQDIEKRALLAIWDTKESLAIQKFAIENQSAYSRHLEILSRYLKLGRARETDFLQAQVSAEEAKVEVQQTQLDLDRKVLALEELLGRKVNALDLATEDLRAIPEARSSSPDKNLDLLILDIELKKSEYQKELALAPFRPQLFASAQIGRQSALFSELGKEQAQFSNWGVTLEIPIFAGGGSSHTVQRFTNTIEEIRNQRNAMQLQIERIFSQTFETQRQLRLIGSAIQLNLSRAQSAARKTLSNYERGTAATPNDVLLTLRSLYDVQKKQIHNDFETNRAQLDLCLLKGDLPTNCLMATNSK